MIVAVLDANVLYPARLRDLFLRLALAGLCRVRWSEKILDECFASLKRDRPDLLATYLDRTRHLMTIALPDASVADSPSLQDRIVLPDPDDRHVLAAAVAGDASIIVTSNLSDFPASALAAFGLRAMSPDEFVLLLIGADVDAVRTVAEEQAANLHHPPITVDQLLYGLEAVGLRRSVARLRTTLSGNDVLHDFGR